MARERRPRNFAAMRSDRVRAMAEAEFGRAFKSKPAAVRALSKLPVDRQHELKKGRSGQQPDAARGARRKPPTAASFKTYGDQMRGGVAPAPSSLKLAGAKPEAVLRLARASTGIVPKSHAQALTLLAKFGSSDMAKAAGGAIGLGGLRASSGPTKAELVKQYADRFGVRPSSAVARTKVSLARALSGKAGLALAFGAGALALATAGSGTAQAATEAGMADKSNDAVSRVLQGVNGAGAIALGKIMGMAGPHPGVVGGAFKYGGRPLMYAAGAALLADAVMGGSAKADTAPKGSANNAVYWSDRTSRHDTAGRGNADAHRNAGPVVERRMAPPKADKPASGNSSIDGVKLGLGLGNLALGAAALRGPGVVGKVLGGVMAVAGAGLTATAFDTSAKADTTKDKTPRSDNFRAAQDEGIRNVAHEDAMRGIESGMQNVGDGIRQTGIGVAQLFAGKAMGPNSILGTGLRWGGRAGIAMGAIQAGVGVIGTVANAMAAENAKAKGAPADAGRKETKVGSGAYLDDGAKSRAQEAPAASSSSKRAAAAPDTRGSGPIQVAGYTKPDGTVVKGYTRQRATQ